MWSTPSQHFVSSYGNPLSPHKASFDTKTYIYIIIIIVLSNLSVSDVSIYFVWLTALLVMRDELEHLWRAISCCRLNRSPHFSHLNGSFARSATVLLLLAVPQCDKQWCKPDQIDRDVRHGQLLKTTMMMYTKYV